MKIIFIDTYYPRFLRTFWNENRSIRKKFYEEQKKKLLGSFFGTANSFSYYLRKLGFVADDIIANDEILQKRWAVENGIKIHDDKFVSKLQKYPYLNRLFGKPSWIQKITLEQIKYFKPDVVYMQNLEILNVRTLNEVKKNCKLLVGQIASPLPETKYLKKFDLVVSSFPHFVKTFRKMGVKSEYQKLAFDSRILNKIGRQKKKYDVTFIGSFSPYHTEGTKILEKLAKRTPVQVWGQGVEFLSPFSSLRRHYHGKAWGLAMYKIIAQSKIVINRHIDVSENYANNMRLYETTGMGTMLLTDRKRNLQEIFTIGKEIVDYSDAEDLIGKVGYYLKNGFERERIAKAGQKKTLKIHAYSVRMKELGEIIYKYMQ